MRLTTADIHPTDIKTIEALVASMKRGDSTVTVKKYARWCIVEMTNQLLAGIAKEQAEKAAKLAEGAEDGKGESTAEHAGSISIEANSGEGVNSEAPNPEA